MDVVKKENIEFSVVGGVLTQMKSMTDLVIDAYIPKRLPNGVKINAIGMRFCKGFYNKIVIDDDIKEIWQGAFECSCVKEVVWPSNCSVIPENCFSCNNIESVSNTDNVTTIMRYAFSGSGVKKFNWPFRCKKIPYQCFYNSKLEYIFGIDNVKTIDASAF